MLSIHCSPNLYWYWWFPWPRCRTLSLVLLNFNNMIFITMNFLIPMRKRQGKIKYQSQPVIITCICMTNLIRMSCFHQLNKKGNHAQKAILGHPNLWLGEGTAQEKFLRSAYKLSLGLIYMHNIGTRSTGCCKLFPWERFQGFLLCLETWVIRHVLHGSLAYEDMVKMWLFVSVRPATSNYIIIFSPLNIGVILQT